MLDRIGFQFLKLGKLIFLYSRFNDFFSQRESVGTLLVSYIFSFGGDAFTKKVLLIFRRFTQMGFGFNFFINLRRFTPTMLCKLLLLFASTVCLYYRLSLLSLRTFQPQSGEGVAETCNWANQLSI